MDLRSPLSKAKGLGSAKSGLAHWWVQRVTAVALIPLVIWFVVNIIQAVGTEDHLLAFARTPLNAIMMVLFLVTSFYHASLGMQVVIEDYVHCHTMKVISVVGVQLLCLVSAVAGTVAVLALHFSYLML
jgi:succinate dehydrogenase / fumarate reductase membrane anchor subunit